MEDLCECDAVDEIAETVESMEELRGILREFVLSIVTVGVIEVGELGGELCTEVDELETFRNWLCVGGLAATERPSPP